jgi:cytochrome c oxidase subunit III
MDIPYTSQPRPDTGLYNAKVGIWLFLASEVMLFGAFFSSYVLLRVGATQWPHGLLNVPIGAFNTLVLIASSVTVVMAWASLKMNQFGRFKIYQGLTILCALIFLGVKSFEYREKFVHYEVWLNDGRQFTGHIEGNPAFMTHLTLRDPKKPVESFKFHTDPKKHAAGEGHAAAAHGEEMVIKTADVKRLSSYVPAHSTYFAIYFTMTALHALHVLAGALVMAYFWGPGSAMWKTDPERFINRIEVSGLFWHFVDLVWIFLFPVLYLL